MTQKIAALVREIRGCSICSASLPLAPRPIIQVGQSAQILIVGQAPGMRAHETNTAFNDASGDRLRDWLGIDKTVFYDGTKIALVPMGFCFPGTGKSGDLAPRPECARTWRKKVLDQLPQIELTILVGKYAQAWHLGKQKKENLTATVRSWQEYWPHVIPLPHPSPINNIWLKKNEWFKQEVLTELKVQVKKVLQSA